MRLKKAARQRLLLCLFCALTAGGVLMVCSASSPLYPFNHWGDANTYFTIGRGMLKGLVPYRDLIDHKGPLIFFLHMFAAMVSTQTFWGVWLLEFLSGALFLYFSSRTVSLFASEGWALASIPLMALLTYSSTAFSLGDSAEEFCLPLLAFSLYSFCRLFKTYQNWRPGLGLVFLNGIAAGLIFWTKFTMIGFHFGWMAVLAFVLWLQDRSFAKAVKASLLFLAGMAAVTLPLLLYFGCTGTLPDLFKVYFYDNLFNYVQSPTHWSEPFYNIFMAGLDALKANPALIALDLIGAFGVLFLRRFFEPAGRAAFLILVFFTGLSIWGASRGFPYYALPFACFLPLGIAAAAQLPWARFMRPAPSPHRHLPVLLVGLCVLCVGLSYKLSPNTFYMQYSTADTPQAKLASIINEADGKTMLSYRCFDIGFYAFSNITPTCKYFTHLNLSGTDELEQTVDSMVSAGSFDFIVITSPIPYKTMKEHYELVSAADWIIEGDTVTYHLYQKKSLETI